MMCYAVGSRAGVPGGGLLAWFTVSSPWPTTLAMESDDLGVTKCWICGSGFMKPHSVAETKFEVWRHSISKYSGNDTCGEKWAASYSSSFTRLLNMEFSAAAAKTPRLSL